MPFQASEYVESIDSIFAVDEAEGKLVWNNEAFSDGTARFCADPAGALYAVFLGPLPGDCIATEMTVKDRKLGSLNFGLENFGPRSYELILLR